MNTDDPDVCREGKITTKKATTAQIHRIVDQQMASLLDNSTSDPRKVGKLVEKLAAEVRQAHEIEGTLKAKQRLTEQETTIGLAMETIITAMGLDLADPEIAETPIRVAKFFLEFRQEYDLDDILGGGFSHPKDAEGAMIVQKDIPFRSMCLHHFAPFFGKAAIGYIPRKKMVGLSKLTRLVQAIGTTAPSTQEVITNKIARALSDNLDCMGVIVVTDAEHTCMTTRGVNSPGVITSVSSIKGVFRDVPAAREEFFNIIGRSR